LEVDDLQAISHGIHLMRLKEESPPLLASFNNVVVGGVGIAKARSVNSMVSSLIS
jgi:hypothetical protein